MATTTISLVREMSEAVGAPRSLWVPFALGRPLGSAHDTAVQIDVIRAAFDLLATATGPTLVDYPHDVPDEAGPEAWACPLNLVPESTGSLTERLLAEVTRLRPWALETRRDRGRTLFGASGASPDQVDLVAEVLAGIAESGAVTELPDADAEWAFDMPLLIRHLADDLRTFYHEGIAGQPGPTAPNHDALNEWIFSATVLGEVLTAIGDHLGAVPDTPMAQLVRGLLIPEGHYRSGSAF